MSLTTAAPAHPPPPSRYVAQHLLGAGGMSEVWRAQDQRLGGVVAVKICRVEVARDPHLRRRFEREAQLTAQLRHPGIPAVHDLGVRDWCANRWQRHPPERRFISLGFRLCRSWPAT